jgi:superfamily II RNA helicase
MSFLQIPDAMVAPAEWPPAEPLALPTKYELDPFQKHAVLGIHAGDHVFVTAKTGSGKTFVGEYLIAYWLARGKRVFYTTPIKSLSNQKYHDLKKLFSRDGSSAAWRQPFPNATVGILTGDIKMCPDAQIVVMTAEILRTLLYKRGTATENVGLTAAVSLDGVAGVVMDEVHYIQDPDRGHVWEESLILCPSTGVADIQLVLLSATLPSAANLAGWLANLHQRRTWLLSTTYRIVPLVHGVLTPEGTVVPVLDPQGRWIGDAYTGWIRDRKAVADAATVYKKAVENRALTGNPSGPKVRVEDPVARLLRTVQWLKERGNLPALFFVFSRKECERYAALMNGSFLDSSDSAAAAHIIDFHLSRHKEILQKSPQYHAIRDLLLRGIAFHHSGLQPLLKEIVEIMFTRGYVKILFATETFSVGLNMPTKTVVFLGLEKWTDGGQQRLLRPDEYIQMAGRAGRRGLDTQGLVLYQPMRDPVDSSELRGLLTGALPALQSRMRFHYDFLLKQFLNPASVNLANQSYWAQEQKATRVSLGTELAQLESRLSSKTVNLEIGELIDLETQVATSVNAKRKKAQQALTKWLAEHDSKQTDRYKADYIAYMQLKAERDKLATAVANWDAAPLLSLVPQETCLRAWGFLEDGITPLGIAATEVNEGHSILMPLLATSGRLDTLTGEEIACILAGCIREHGSEEVSLSASGLRPEAISALQWLDDTARACQRTEDMHGVLSPPHFWDLSALWVCVAARWLAGYGLTEIAKEFELFEGNVQRGLLRVANLLEEWGAVATLRQDLATLEKLASLQFLRNEVIVDSLYLRL